MWRWSHHILCPPHTIPLPSAFKTIQAHCRRDHIYYRRCTSGRKASPTPSLRQRLPTPPFAYDETVNTRIFHEPPFTTGRMVAAQRNRSLKTTAVSNHFEQTTGQWKRKHGPSTNRNGKKNNIQNETKQKQKRKKKTEK